MKKALLVSLMLILVAGLMFIACSEEEEEPSIAITSLTATPGTVIQNSTSGINAEVEYSGDKAVSYAWSCDHGSISGAGNSVSWIAPDTTGNYSINLTATDGDVSDDGSVVVQVVPEGDDTIRITSLVAYPLSIHPGGTSAITANVDYICSGTVNYDWD